LREFSNGCFNRAVGDRLRLNLHCADGRHMSCHKLCNADGCQSGHRTLASDNEGK
jgi:hypothetical protein